jgi:hypothetical protein
MKNKKFDIKKFLKENDIFLGTYKTNLEQNVFKGMNDKRRNSRSVDITPDGKLNLYTKKEVVVNKGSNKKTRKM